MKVLVSQSCSAAPAAKSLQSCQTLYNLIDGSPQAPLSIGFSRQEYWSGFPLPAPGGLPDSGIEPRYPALQANSLQSEPPGNPKVIRQGIRTSSLFFL